MVAPYEADAQLAHLSRTGAVDAVITEDSDCLPYGCKKVNESYSPSLISRCENTMIFLSGYLIRVRITYAGCPQRCGRHLCSSVGSGYHDAFLDY